MRTASYTDTSFSLSSYQSCPSEQYRELKEKLSRLPSDTPCFNVRVDYSLIHEDGSGGAIRYIQNEIPVKELLRVISCAPPRKTNPLAFEEVQKCWMLNAQDKV